MGRAGLASLLDRLATKQFWLKSSDLYGYSKIANDLRDLGKHCGKQRVYCLVNQEGLRAQVGYRHREEQYGKPAVVAEGFFQLLKPERTHRKIYLDRKEVRRSLQPHQDVP